MGRPLWRKAPTRLKRRPTLFAALASGAVLVAVATAAYPMFLSAATSRLLASTIANPTYSRYGVGITYRATEVPFDATAPYGGSLSGERQRAFVAAAAANPVLDGVVSSMAAPAVQVRRDREDRPREPRR